MIKDPSQDWDWVWASRNIKDKSYGFLSFGYNIKNIKEEFMEKLYQYSKIYWSEGGIKDSLMAFFCHQKNRIVSIKIFGYEPIEGELEDLESFSTKSSNWRNLKSINV
jgi:hypothetical protein